MCATNMAMMLSTLVFIAKSNNTVQCANRAQIITTIYAIAITAFALKREAIMVSSESADFPNNVSRLRVCLCECGREFTATLPDDRDYRTTEDIAFCPECDERIRNAPSVLVRTRLEEA